MVSSRTSRGAAAAIAALEMGTFECIAKPAQGEHDAFADVLAETVKAASVSRLQLASTSGARGPAPKVSGGRAYRWDGRILAIGASTGGVEALIAVLSSFPPDCPPTIVAQHMPATFTRSFAQRLDRLCSPSICEAYDDAPLKPGKIYLAPGGVAHLEIAGPGPLRCRLQSGSAVNGHRPSVDVLFQSVAKVAGARALGVILTGMGRDGAGGLLAMRQAGAATIGQDEASSLIYGMPKAALEIGAIEKQAPLNKIAAEILSKTSLP
jgi:two-component system chemotaxis response regulator CheB